MTVLRWHSVVSGIMASLRQPRTNLPNSDLPSSTNGTSPIAFLALQGGSKKKAVDFKRICQ